jgi:PAS domain S-box-containing protein
LKTINHLFSSQTRFESFLLENNLNEKKEHFIQIFVGNNNPRHLKNVLKIIHKSLPLAKIIATSTSGEIVEGGMLDNSTVVSISSFEDTQVKVKLIEATSPSGIVDEVISLSSSKTKLILAFNNVYENDAEEILNIIEKKLPNIKIAGGNAGDNGNFSHQTLVGVDDKVSTTAFAVAVFDSDILQVFNDFLFNWQTIGEKMLITKAEKNTIYEINNKKAQDIYKLFLGEEVTKNLPKSGIEFPLIFQEDGISIARAPVAIGEDGSLIMAGHIKENTQVKFGFGDIAENDKNVTKSIQSFSANPIESIFIYSCAARKYFLQDHLNSEFEMLQQIAPTSGFVTYGEFFKQEKCIKMLNVSSTFIGLSENPQVKHEHKFNTKYVSNTTRTLNALTHLVKQTSKHLEEKNLSLNQFQKLIKDGSIYSSTDTKGIITDVNQRFVDLTGYSREELIGKPHNIVRHPSMPSSLFKEMWASIKNKKTWQGIVKNKAKDGSKYYVRSSIFPILDIDGNITKYISIRDDITEEMQRKELLEGTLDYLDEKTKEKDYLLDQYEKTINMSSAFFRVDKDFNLIHVNDVFCDIYNCSANELRKKHISDILEPEFFKTQFQDISAHRMEHGTWSGIIPFQKYDKTIIYMKTSANTIYNKANELVEIMVVLHDITDLIIAQQEIQDTQRDVVYTMGAIGESRSKETGNHVKRVAEYSRILALKCGLGKEKAELLKMASPMHDIGKVGIPDDILNKPGKLNDKEWSIMKSHSKLGYSMLKNSKREILQTAAIVAHTHHEQWDGNGYPKGLKGEEIHIFGRITAIADVFDALGSDRCYKKAWDDEKIFELIRNGRGKHFDPKLVDIFFDNLSQFLEIRSSFKD